MSQQCSSSYNSSGEASAPNAALAHSADRLHTTPKRTWTVSGNCARLVLNASSPCWCHLLQRASGHIREESRRTSAASAQLSSKQPSSKGSHTARGEVLAESLSQIVMAPAADAKCAHNTTPACTNFKQEQAGSHFHVRQSKISAAHLSLGKLFVECRSEAFICTACISCLTVHTE